MTGNKGGEMKEPKNKNKHRKTGKKYRKRNKRNTSRRIKARNTINKRKEW